MVDELLNLRPFAIGNYLFLKHRIRQTRLRKSRRPELPGGGVSWSARPDQLVLPVTLDQVRVDRSGEARIVQLEADELATALAGASPARADLDLADERPVVGSGIAALLDRSDRDLGLEADGLDRAVEAAVGLREGADGCHEVSLLFVYLSRANRSLDGRDRAGPAPAAPEGP